MLQWCNCLWQASEDLEDRESLAQIAASQNDQGTSDGETYIEKYIKGVSAVDSILALDRLRQVHFQYHSPCLCCNSLWTVLLFKIFLMSWNVSGLQWQHSDSMLSKVRNTVFIQCFGTIGEDFLLVSFESVAYRNSMVAAWCLQVTVVVTGRMLLFEAGLQAHKTHTTDQPSQC